MLMTGNIFILMTCLQHSSPDPGRLTALEEALRRAIEGQATVYGIVYQRLDHPEQVTINAEDLMHAASTMKVPVMLRLFEMVEQGKLSLDQPIPVKNRFKSILDGSEYLIDVDSDQELYGHVGQSLPLHHLIELMIVRSSNLATNILVELADAPSIMDLMNRLGADPIKVLRGVQDLKAYEAGLSNRCSAQAMATVMAATGDSPLFSGKSRERMLAILRRQQFTEMIPAGLPPEAGARVANKTGSISSVQHDAAYITLPGGVRYVLVVFARDFSGEEGREEVNQTAARLSRLVYQHISGQN